MTVKKVSTISARCFVVSVTSVSGVFMGATKEAVLFHGRLPEFPSADELGRDEQRATAEAELFTEEEVREIKSVLPRKDKTVASVISQKVETSESGNVAMPESWMPLGRNDWRIRFEEGELFSFPVEFRGSAMVVGTISPARSHVCSALNASLWADDDLPF